LDRVKGAAKLGLEQQAQEERQENDLRNPACLGQLHSIRSLSPHKPRATQIGHGEVVSSTRQRTGSAKSKAQLNTKRASSCGGRIAPDRDAW
jgi:hypothetical protein